MGRTKKYLLSIAAIVLVVLIVAFVYIANQINRNEYAYAVQSYMRNVILVSNETGATSYEDCIRTNSLQQPEYVCKYYSGKLLVSGKEKYLILQRITPAEWTGFHPDFFLYTSSNDSARWCYGSLLGGNMELGRNEIKEPDDPVGNAIKKRQSQMHADSSNADARR